MSDYYGGLYQEPALRGELNIVRAILAWRRIIAKPSIVYFEKANGDIVPAQVVRIESDSRASVLQAVSGRAPKRQVVIFGVRDHPTVPDTIVREGYIFNIGNDRYTVKDLVETLGEVQAMAEASR